MKLRQILLLMSLAAVFRAGLGLEKRGYEHDEQISLLTSSCHHLELEAARPRLEGRWIEAAELKAFVEAPEHACWGEVRATLAQLDIHPPLYFWLLHASYLGVGNEPWVGPALNGLLAMATLLVLYLTFRRLDPSRAAGAVTLWAVATGPVLAAYQARSYGLATLLGWSLLLVDLRARGLVRFLGWVTCIALLGLTHLQLVYLPVALFAVRGFEWLRERDRERRDALIGLGCAGVVALGLVLLVHPAVLEGAARGLGRGSDAVFEPLRRVEILSRNLLGFAISPRIVGRLISTSAPVAALAVAALAIFAARRRGWSTERTARIHRVMGLWLAALALPYLLCWVPEPILRDPRYLAPLYPWLAWWLAGVWPARRSAPVLGGLTLVTVVAMIATHRPLEPAQHAEWVVIDGTKRGWLPGALEALPDEAQVWWGMPPLEAGWELPSGRLVWAAGGASADARAAAFAGLKTAERSPTRVGLSYWVAEPTVAEPTADE